MLRLKLPTEPYWIDLPEGVRVHVRPADTAMFAAARARAARSVGKLREEIDARREAGAGLDGLPNLDDANEREGYVHYQTILALARGAILAWEGVAPAEGEGTAPVTDRTVADLMRFPVVAERFFDLYITPLTDQAAEGNASRPAPNGTGDAGLAIAPGAKKRKRGARKVEPA